MEPITTAVAAVAAASNAIAFIKARINDVQSVADISQQVSTLLTVKRRLMKNVTSKLVSLTLVLKAVWMRFLRLKNYKNK